jgi:hypothetical protein
MAGRNIVLLLDSGKRRKMGISSGTVAMPGFGRGVHHVTRILRQRARALLILAGVLVIFPATRAAQDNNSTPAPKSDAAQQTIKLTIAVTGGDEKKPVDSASVYVRYISPRKYSKDKHVEMNLKTNLSGLCHVPEIPAGKIEIQVIAPGWKTFGEWYDLNQPEQTINISLMHPPKWY